MKEYLQIHPDQTKKWFKQKFSKSYAYRNTPTTMNLYCDRSKDISYRHLYLHEYYNNYIKTDRKVFLDLQFLEVRESLFNTDVLWECLPPFIRESIKHDNLYMVIDFSTEAEDYCKHITNFCERLNIPRHKVVYLTSHLTLKNPHSYSVRTFELFAHAFYPVIQYNPTVYRRRVSKYLNYNGRFRYHRAVMVSLMEYYEQLDYGYNSFCGYDIITDKSMNVNLSEQLKMLSYKSAYSDNRELMKRVLSGGKRLEKKLPLYVDWDPSINGDVSIFNSDTMSLYTTSYYSIISETNYESEIVDFFTEKTYRTIGRMHPFILCGSVGSLENLRSTGYKTFHPFINESYDKEPNNSKRMEMLLDEIKRLNSLSLEELDKLIANVTPILEHNYHRLRDIDLVVKHSGINTFFKFVTSKHV